MVSIVARVVAAIAAVAEVVVFIGIQDRGDVVEV
jgi:hypothetical protein